MVAVESMRDKIKSSKSTTDFSRQPSPPLQQGEFFFVGCRTDTLKRLAGDDSQAKGVKPMKDLFFNNNSIICSYFYICSYMSAILCTGHTPNPRNESGWIIFIFKAQFEGKRTARDWKRRFGWNHLSFQFCKRYIWRFNMAAGYQMSKQSLICFALHGWFKDVIYYSWQLHFIHSTNHSIISITYLEI